MLEREYFYAFFAYARLYKLEPSLRYYMSLEVIRPQSTGREIIAFNIGFAWIVEFRYSFIQLVQVRHLTRAYLGSIPARAQMHEEFRLFEQALSFLRAIAG